MKAFCLFTGGWRKQLIKTCRRNMKRQSLGYKKQEQTLGESCTCMRCSWHGLPSKFVAVGKHLFGLSSGVKLWESWRCWRWGIREKIKASSAGIIETKLWRNFPELLKCDERFMKPSRWFHPGTFKRCTLHEINEINNLKRKFCRTRMKAEVWSREANPLTKLKQNGNLFADGKLYLTTFCRRRIGCRIDVAEL